MSLVESEWPSLGGGEAAATSVPCGIAGNSNDNSGKEQKQPEEHDWEVLAPGNTDVCKEGRGQDGSGSHGQGGAAISEDDPQRLVVVIDNSSENSYANPKKLRHSASSPDLRHLHSGFRMLEQITERSVDGSQDDEMSGAPGFAVVDGPPSVISASSTAAASTAAGGLSWATKAASAGTGGFPAAPRPTTAVSRKQQQRKFQPGRFVVVPPKTMRRCSRSTGDLQALIEVEEEGEVLGESDAMEFYHRKALGVKGRTNGQKLRPDEAKRKEITMHKKHLQRQAQQAG